MAFCAQTMFSCDKHEETDLYNNSPAVNLSDILDANGSRDVMIIFRYSPTSPTAH